MIVIEPLIFVILIFEFVVALTIVVGVARAIWNDDHRHILVPDWMRRKPDGDAPDVLQS